MNLINVGRYFDEDEEAASSSTLEYIPAPGSPTYEAHMKKNSKQNASDSEEDPLDAFMAGIDAEIQKSTSKVPDSEERKDKGVRADIDNEDDQESYYR